MKTLFSIGTIQEKTDLYLLELASDHFILAMGDSENKHIHYLQYLSVDEPLKGKDLQLFLDGINVSAAKIVVGPAYSQAALIPIDLAKNNSFISILHDLSGETIHSDDIPAWQMQTEYAIPLETERVLKDKFPAAIYKHHYTATLLASGTNDLDSELNVQFHPCTFRVMVKSRKRLLLMQTYAYKTPLDVVYYLLKICYEMSLDQKEVTLVVGGLIDNNSALFKELNHYFLNISFEKKPFYTLPDSDLPSYYFTSVINLAACVS